MLRVMVFCKCTESSKCYFEKNLEDLHFVFLKVCFIGQSNVGKSSLIKTLLNERKKVKINISKTPVRHYKIFMLTH